MHDLKDNKMIDDSDTDEFTGTQIALAIGLGIGALCIAGYLYRIYDKHVKI